METKELKFLLKLLGCPDYRSPLSAKPFNSIKGKNKLVRDLETRGWLDFSREIASVKILPPGRALLNVEPDQVPLSPSELRVLNSIGKASGKVKPSKIDIKSLKSAERDAILQRFHERGFIEVEKQLKRQKAEVWMTQRGLDQLREDYIPKKGTNPVISLELLGNYLLFLRKSLPSQVNPSVSVAQPQPSLSSEPVLTQKPTDTEILQLIQQLDKKLGTDNYLPIFHLRQKLQPPLSRDDLDQALYRLQREDKIELSSLVEAMHYTSEQLQAGIPQEIGGSLFFIIVN